MARTRTIKPGFFRSESLSKCEPMARILFAGLWTEADDEGRGDATPRLLSTALFPWDDVPDVKVRDWLEQLEETGHVVLYQHRSKRLFQIVNWDEHQSAAFRRGGSTLPAPPDGSPPSAPEPPPKDLQADDCKEVQEVATPLQSDECKTVLDVEGSGGELSGGEQTAQIDPVDNSTNEAPEDVSGTDDSSPREITQRHRVIATQFGRETTTRAIAKGKKVGKFSSYAASITKSALENNDELYRLADLFPTAPASVIVAAMFGEKHSLQVYPRAEDVMAAEGGTKQADVIPFNRKDSA